MRVTSSRTHVRAIATRQVPKKRRSGGEPFATLSDLTDVGIKT